MRDSDLQGVPESITRRRYMALIKAAGFELADLVSLRFAYNGIHAEVLATGENNRLVSTRDDDGEPIAATHTIFIPVVD